MRRSLRTAAVALALTTLSAGAAFASVTNEWGTSGWVKSESGTQFVYTDGTNATPGWHWLTELEDPNYYGRCYYFDQNGYLVTNTTTPDGYTVNAKGEWTVNGEVQKKLCSDYEHYGVRIKNKTAADFDTSFLRGTNSEYNQYGISRTAISMLSATRKENAKYGEVSSSESSNYLDVTYANGFTVGYPTNSALPRITLDMSKVKTIANNYGVTMYDINGTKMLKYYFPNHQLFYDRVADSKEKWDLLKEFGFPVDEEAASFYVDECIIDFSEGDQRFYLKWFCNNTLVLYANQQ